MDFGSTSCDSTGLTSAPEFLSIETSTRFGVMGAIRAPPMKKNYAPCNLLHSLYALWVLCIRKDSSSRGGGGGSCPQSLRTMPNYWFRCLTQNPKKNPEVCDDCLPLSAAPPDVVVDNSPTMLPTLALNVALVMVRTRLGVLMTTGAPPMNKNYLPCNKQTFICIGYSHYALYMFIPKQVVMVACHYLNCLQMLW